MAYTFFPILIVTHASVSLPYQANNYFIGQCKQESASGMQPQTSISSFNLYPFTSIQVIKSNHIPQCTLHNHPPLCTTILNKCNAIRSIPNLCVLIQEEIEPQQFSQDEKQFQHKYMLLLPCTNNETRMMLGMEIHEGSTRVESDLYCQKMWQSVFDECVS